MTVEEVGEELRLHPRVVRRLIREEGLPALKLGKPWRIARDDLDRWLDAQRADSPA